MWKPALEVRESCRTFAYGLHSFQLFGEPEGNGQTNCIAGVFAAQTARRSYKKKSRQRLEPANSALVSPLEGKKMGQPRDIFRWLTAAVKARN